MTPDDRDLRERFAALRAEEQRRAPRFSAVWAAAEDRRGRRQGRRAGLRLAAAFAGAALLTLAVFVWRPSSPPPPAPGSEPVPPSITEWRAPTDFLLETPGREVLRTVPRFGRSGLPVDRTRLAPPAASPTSDPAHRRRES